MNNTGDNKEVKTKLVRTLDVQRLYTAGWNWRYGWGRRVRWRIQLLDSIKEDKSYAEEKRTAQDRNGKGLA